jgi:WD40 repeat protein
VAKREADLPSSIRNLTREEFAFIDNDRLLGINPSSPDKSPLLQFPGGGRLQEVKLSNSLHLITAAHGNCVLVGPLKSGKLGILDLSKGRLVSIFKEDSGDVYDNTLVFEEIDGKILLADTTSSKVIVGAQLIQSRLGDNRAIAVSSDFNWLAVSTSSRGAVWDLTHNIRVQHVRGFVDGWFAEDDSFYGDFPKLDRQERAVVHLDALGNAVPIYSIGELLATQQGPYLMLRTPAHDNPYARKNWTYELQDFRTKTTVWSRRFPQEPPSMAWNPNHSAVLMGWHVSEGTAHDELKQFSDLKNSAEREDILYELVDVRSNSVVSKLLVKTNKSSFTVKRAEVDGQCVALQVSGDRVITYSLSSGKELGHVFGSAPVISSAAGEYAVSTAAGELNVYDFASSQLHHSYKFPASVAYKEFSSDGRRLFVLTRDQTAYVLDLSRSQMQSSDASRLQPH